MYDYVSIYVNEQNKKKNEKKLYRPCELIIHYIKVCVRGSALHGYVSMMRRR